MRMLIWVAFSDKHHTWKGCEVTVPAVTMNRIEALLKDNELDCRLDEEGNLSLPLVGLYFNFEIIKPGGILRIFGAWRGAAQDAETIKRLQDYIAALHIQTVYFPKFFILYDKDDSARLAYEYCMPVGSGLTDEQLDDIAFEVMQTTVWVERELRKAFPDLVTWDPGNQGEV